MATTEKVDSSPQLAVALVQVGEGQNILLPWNGTTKDPSGLVAEELTIGNLPNGSDFIYGYLLSDIMDQKEVDQIIDLLERDTDLNAWQVEVGEVPAFGPDDTADTFCDAAEATWQIALDKYVADQKAADDEAKAQKKAKQTRAASARKAKAKKPKTPSLPDGVDTGIVTSLMAVDTSEAEDKILKTATGQTTAQIRKAVQDWLNGPKESFVNDADFRRDITSFLKTTQKAIKNGDLKADELDAAALYGLWTMVNAKEGGAPLRPKKSKKRTLTKK